MAVINSTVKVQMYIEILDTFLIPSINSMFSNKYIFQDDDASCHKA